MNEVVRTALRFIQVLLQINAMVIEKNGPGFCLPSPHATEMENQAVRDYLAGVQDNSICMVTDGRLVRYCIAQAVGVAVLMGPYHEQTLSRAEALRALAPDRPDDRALDKFLFYHNSLPIAQTAMVHLAAETLLSLLCETAQETKETTIQLHKAPLREGEWPQDNWPEGMDGKQSLAFLLMAQVTQGSYEGALAAYRELMRLTMQQKAFEPLNAIEGMSQLRMMVRLSMQRAGVPAQAREELMTQHRLAARRISGNEQRSGIDMHLLSQACFLVRQYRKSHYSPSIQTVLDIIHRNLAHLPNVSQIAAQAELSPNWLSAKFRSEVGMPITEYVSRLRMAEAEELLAFTKMRVQDICSRVGMLDSGYFTRCFKKEFGVTPTQYRKNNPLTP